MKKRLSWLICLSVAAVLHASLARGEDRPAAPRAWPVASSPAALIVLDACPMSAVAGRTESGLAVAAASAAVSLLTPVVTAAVSAGLDAVAGVLDRYADSYGASTTASGAGVLLTGKGDVAEPAAGCLVFVRGALKSVKPAEPPARLPGIRDEQWRSQVSALNQKLRAAAEAQQRPVALRLESVPEVYAEFQFRYRQFARVDGGQPVLAQLALQPILFFFGQTAAERGRNDEKTLVMQVSLTTLTPGTDKPRVLLAQVFDFGRLKPQSAVCQPVVLPELTRTLVGCAREFFAEPAFQAINAGNLVAVPVTAADGKPTQVVLRDPIHLHAQGSLTELQQAGDFARVFGDALRKDAVAKEVSSKAVDLMRALARPAGETQ